MFLLCLYCAHPKYCILATFVLLVIGCCSTKKIVKLIACNIALKNNKVFYKCFKFTVINNNLEHNRSKFTEWQKNRLYSRRVTFQELFLYCIEYLPILYYRNKYKTPLFLYIILVIGFYGRRYSIILSIRLLSIDYN